MVLHLLRRDVKERSGLKATFLTDIIPVSKEIIVPCGCHLISTKYKEGSSKSCNILLKFALVFTIDARYQKCGEWDSDRVAPYLQTGFYLQFYLQVKGPFSDSTTVLVCLKRIDGGTVSTADELCLQFADESLQFGDEASLQFVVDEEQPCLPGQSQHQEQVSFLRIIFGIQYFRTGTY